MKHNYLVEKRFDGAKDVKYVPVFYCEFSELYFSIGRSGKMFSSNCLDLLLSEQGIIDFFFSEHAKLAINFMQTYEAFFHEHEKDQENS